MQLHIQFLGLQDTPQSGRLIFESNGLVINFIFFTFSRDVAGTMIVGCEDMIVAESIVKLVGPLLSRSVCEEG